MYHNVLRLESVNSWIPTCPTAEACFSQHCLGWQARVSQVDKANQLGFIHVKSCFDFLNSMLLASLKRTLHLWCSYGDLFERMVDSFEGF